jgi:AraC family transcriptional regulator, transcriptional activator of the genes for pyochelin and ferripyochelin receptors
MTGRNFYSTKRHCEAFRRLDKRVRLHETQTGNLLVQKNILDYRTLFETNSPPRGMALDECAYQKGDGIQYRSDSDGSSCHEAVRLSEGAFLLTTNYTPDEGQRHQQVVNDGDWIHIQFRFSGAGCERVSKQERYETPEKCCIVSRYPKGSIVDREIWQAKRWKYACLYISPNGLVDFLDTPVAALPEEALWLGRDSEPEFKVNVLPLHPMMMIAVNDMLACSFRGRNRRAYMRAKSLELLTIVIHGLRDNDGIARGSPIRLSAADIDKIANARAIMNAELENTLTLAELARRLGLNRTKLALGFKELYGTSVQAYWRDAKLTRARELLQTGRARITEVALDMGYSELSSFTRAFTRKFGLLPRECKKIGRS